MDFRLHCNRTMCIVGPSHSGKTSFVLKLLENRYDIFNCAPNRVIWCYGIYQHELNNNLQQQGYLLHSGIINTNEVEPYDIIVLDDLLNESKNSQEVTAMFTRAAHHKPCFIIFIMQNLFPTGKEARTRSLNTHYSLRILETSLKSNSLHVKSLHGIQKRSFRFLKKQPRDHTLIYF